MTQMPVISDFIIKTIAKILKVSWKAILAIVNFCTTKIPKFFTIIAKYFQVIDKKLPPYTLQIIILLLAIAIGYWIIIKRWKKPPPSKKNPEELQEFQDLGSEFEVKSQKQIKEYKISGNHARLDQLDSYFQFTKNLNRETELETQSYENNCLKKIPMEKSDALFFEFMKTYRYISQEQQKSEEM